MEKLAAALEERSGRLDMLRANLEEQPGHRPTIETLARVLEARNRHGELVDILSGQATRLEERGDGASAARMWDWIAQILEQPIGDRDRAIRAYERVAELGPRPETFESLGRLLLDKGDPANAAGWLARWQDAAQGPVRTRAALELANAYLQADKRQRAVGCLERALAEEPKANEVRARLVDLYREDQAWEPLVRVLNDGTAYVGDREAILASAREAAEISQNRLAAPQAALGALERAVALSPGDTSLRSQYADALSAAGEVGKAREILEGLIKDSGRRRSKERAALHHRLAKVARAENKPKEALAHLEQAADMDMDNAAVVEALGEVAEQSGEVDRAESAYRALVLLLRRGGKPATLTTTLALLRLRKMALSRGQEDKAQDLLDSAISRRHRQPRGGPAPDRCPAGRGGQGRAAHGPGPASGVGCRAGATGGHPGRTGRAGGQRGPGRQGPGVAAVGAGESARGPGDSPGRSAGGQAGRPQGGASERVVAAMDALASERRRAEDAALHATLLSEAGESRPG